MNLDLDKILDELRDEIPATHFNGRPKGKCCKYCNTMLAVAMEEATIVHLRKSGGVEVKCLYHGKAYCRMCHKFQA